mgnify:CR=1 FL=1
MTEKLYYRDAYATKFTARVLDCTEEKKHWTVILNRTLFYPEGGGQPADIGVLGGVRVLDVHERGEDIVHTTDKPLPVGAEVEGEIDWEHRFDLMQNHSGEHILSGVICGRYGCDNVGFHMGKESITIDLNTKIPAEDLPYLEEKANEAIWTNTPVGIRYPSKEELAKLEYRSKKELEGQVRIVNVGEYDCCACCAPHVTYTGEIGLIKLVQAQRYKGGVRITMLCGVRAFSDYVRKEAQAKEISRLLCAKENEIADAVAHLAEETNQLKYELAEKERRLVKAYADMISESKDAVCIFTEEFGGDSMRMLMNYVLDAGHCICAVFFGNEKDGYRYVLGSRQQDVREMAKEFNKRFDGRGGGKPEMVQGTVRGEKEAIERWLMKYEFVCI